MKRAFRFSVLFLVVLALGACATTQVSPARTYYEAQQVYISAWNDYHLVWSALPETDPSKAEWVQKYHPKFATAASLLQSWSASTSDPTWATAANQAIDTITQLLVELAIKKGGTQ